MKILDVTLKFTTFGNKTTDSIDQFPSETEEYTTTFQNLH